MSSSTAARLTAPDIMARKGAERIVCLTAYTAPMAALLDPHVDILTTYAANVRAGRFPEKAEIYALPLKSKDGT